jgi:hypothetical protein
VIVQTVQVESKKESIQENEEDTQTTEIAFTNSKR